MHPFLERYADDVLGMLSGFDRLRLRGTLRRIANVQGMATFLSQQHVLFKDFGEYVHDATTRVKQASEALTKASHKMAESLYRDAQTKGAGANAELGSTAGPLGQ